MKMRRSSYIYKPRGGCWATLAVRPRGGYWPTLAIGQDMVIGTGHWDCPNSVWDCLGLTMSQPKPSWVCLNFFWDFFGTPPTKDGAFLGLCLGPLVSPSLVWELYPGWTT